jgi:hypothetical protein
LQATQGNGVEELLTATEVELAIRKISKEIQPGMNIEFLAQLAHQLRIGKTPPCHRDQPNS